MGSTGFESVTSSVSRRRLISLSKHAPALSKRPVFLPRFQERMLYYIHSPPQKASGKAFAGELSGEVRSLSGVAPRRRNRDETRFSLTHGFAPLSRGPPSELRAWRSWAVCGLTPLAGRPASFPLPGKSADRRRSPASAKRERAARRRKVPCGRAARRSGAAWPQGRETLLEGGYPLAGRVVA